MGIGGREARSHSIVEDERRGAEAQREDDSFPSPLRLCVRFSIWKREQASMPRMKAKILSLARAVRVIRG
jgi:hypothetical protein